MLKINTQDFRPSMPLIKTTLDSRPLLGASKVDL